MVYFLTLAEQGNAGVAQLGNPIKIGYTNDLRRRLQQLEKAYGCPLLLLAIAEGGRSEERSLHRRLAYLRIGKTEFFRPGRELLEIIRGQKEHGAAATDGQHCVLEIDVHRLRNL
jgi:hypothetical protein